jgi:hypothetical protein
MSMARRMPSSKGCGRPAAFRHGQHRAFDDFLVDRLRPADLQFSAGLWDDAFDLGVWQAKILPDRNSYQPMGDLLCVDPAGDQDDRPDQDTVPRADDTAPIRTADPGITANDSSAWPFHHLPVDIDRRAWPFLRRFLNMGTRRLPVVGSP